MLAATEQGLAGVWFVHQQEHLPDCSRWVTDDTHATLLAAALQLSEYFQGQRQTFEIQLHPAWGTPFQRAVWQALQRIPYAHTSTYGDISTTNTAALTQLQAANLVETTPTTTITSSEVATPRVIAVPMTSTGA